MSQPDPRPAPKFRRRAEARPDEVLDAALALFTAQGYSGTTMDQVARAAGISKGAVYLYFPSKQDLLQGLVRRAVLPLADQAISGLIPAGGDAAAQLARVVRQIAAGLGAPGGLGVPKLILREAPLVPELAQMYREAVLARVIPALAGLIRAGMAAGQFRPVDPELTVRSVIGPIFIHLILDQIFGLRPERGLALPDLVENHLSILLAGLAAGIAPELAPELPPGKDLP